MTTCLLPCTIQFSPWVTIQGQNMMEMVPASSDGTRGLLISSVMSLNPTAGPFHSEMASDHLDLSGWISVASILETIAVVMVVFFFFFFNCSEGVIFLPGTSPHPTPELLLQMCPVLNFRAFLEVVCSSSTMSRMRCLHVRALFPVSLIFRDLSLEPTVRFPVRWFPV